MADNYDLVIFGSTATARLLAFSLSHVYKMRVLLVVEPDQLHHLPYAPQLSAGYCTSPLFFQRVTQGAVEVQRLLSTLKQDGLTQVKSTSIFARNPQHMPLLEFTEGAAIHADIVSERRVHVPTNSEQLVFPETVFFNSVAISKALAAHNDEQKHYAVISRGVFEKFQISRDGRFSGRSSAGALKADRILLLDQDLIYNELKHARIPAPIVPQWRQVFRFHQQRPPEVAAQQDISTGLWRFQHADSDVLFSAPGQVDQLANHLFRHHSEISDRRLLQMDKIHLLETRDGYLICDEVAGRKVMCFAGAQSYDVALSPELAAHIERWIADGSVGRDPFWLHARIGPQRGGDGTLLRAQLDGAHV